jgi:predicted nucleic acid-binding protein
MAEPQRQAFLDANVLRGQLTTDVLLTLADKGAFEPRWSQLVLEEVRRNRPPGLPEAAIDRRLSQMNRAFPTAMVSGYEHLMPQMQADEKDKHVLAAAVHSEATLLVTENVKDFHPPSTGPHAMHIDRTSEFLNRVVDDNPERVVAAMNEMVSRTNREPNTVSALIDKMVTQNDLKGFAHKLNSVVPPEHRGKHPNLTAGRAAHASASIALDGVAPPKGAASRPTTPPEARQAKQGPETESGQER